MILLNISNIEVAFLTIKRPKKAVPNVMSKTLNKPIRLLTLTKKQFQVMGIQLKKELLWFSTKKTK